MLLASHRRSPAARHSPPPITNCAAHPSPFPAAHPPPLPHLLAGGPFPVIGGPGHAPLTAFLQSWPKTLAAPPKALLVVSAHWEEPVATVTSAARPTLLYDYSGFPPEAYQLKYPAPGSPQLADRVAAALQAAGLECRKDGKRGLDHGGSGGRAASG